MAGTMPKDLLRTLYTLSYVIFLTTPWEKYQQLRLSLRKGKNSTQGPLIRRGGPGLELSPPSYLANISPGLVLRPLASESSRIRAPPETYKIRISGVVPVVHLYWEIYRPLYELHCFLTQWNTAVPSLLIKTAVQCAGRGEASLPALFSCLVECHFISVAREGKASKFMNHGSVYILVAEAKYLLL